MSSAIGELLKKPVSKNLLSNVDTIESICGQNADLVKREFVLHEQRDIPGTIFFTDGLVNTKLIESTILRPLLFASSHLVQTQGESTLNGDMASSILKNLLTGSSIKLTTEMEKVIGGLLSGETILFLDQCHQAFIISTVGFDSRNVEEPQTEAVVKGPRDGFTENIRTNTALIRRRVKDPNLRIEKMDLGTGSKTEINIVYLLGTVKDGLPEEVKTRLQRIETDRIMESGKVEELIKDSPLSPFPTVQSTERPDKVASALFEGRVAIIVDNTPFVMLVPVYFWQFLQASDDYYVNYWTGSFVRMIRYMAFLISLTLPSFYVMLVGFHQEMIPTALAITFAAGREAVPFPSIIEALLMEFAFELMREAGLRMPRQIGQAVSIVGSLVIGEAAVQAGIVSPIMVILIAITGIASFAIPNYSIAYTLRLLRFPLLIASGTMGLLGFSAAFSIIVLHALSIRSFGESYLAPAAPFQPSDQKDLLFRLPWWKMKTNPLMSQEEQIQSKNTIPHPPTADNSGAGTMMKRSRKRPWRKET